GLQSQARRGAEMKDALRSGQKVRLGALRMLSSAIRYREDELHHELSADEVRLVAAREVKRRTESIEAFSAAGREDLVQRETAERDVLRAYAPEQLSDDALDALIDRAIETTGATSPRQMGTVMGVV